MARTAAASLAVAAVLAGCSTGATHGGVSNVAACRVAHTITGKVNATLAKWQPDLTGVPTDPTVAPELRAEARQLFTLERSASGTAAAAIHAVATRLADLSVAVDGGDQATGATAVNGAAAAGTQLDGACS